jgi:hypothetical protein
MLQWIDVVMAVRIGLKGLIGGRGAFESIFPIAIVRPGICWCSKGRAWALPIDNAMIAATDAVIVGLILNIVLSFA